MASKLAAPRKKKTPHGVPSIKQVYLPQNKKEYGRFVVALLYKT